MERIRFVGAPTNLGLKPYDSGGPRHVDEAPAVLRRLGVVARLGAEDTGDVAGGEYVDIAPLPGGIRNAAALQDHALRLGAAVAAATRDGRQVLVAGGDCSVLLGSLAGVTRHGRIGLLYIDAHCDFATPAISHSNSAAGMVLALAVGRGDHALAGLGGDAPLVREEDVVVLGRRDLYDEAFYGEESIRNTPMLDLPWDEIAVTGVAEAAHRALAHLTARGVDGVWIHFDADFLNPDIMAAVDSPEPGGPNATEASDLLRGLWSSPLALGIDVTIYDPSLDAEAAQGRVLADLLIDALAPGSSATTPTLVAQREPG